MKFKLILLLLAITLSVSASNKYLSFSRGFEDSTSYNITKKVTQFDGYTEVKYVFEGAYISDCNYRNENYNNILMQNASVTLQKGEPKLPVYLDMLIVNSVKDEIELVNTEYIEFDGFKILPSPDYSKEKFNVNEELVFSSTYQNNRYYPSYNAKITGKHEYRSIPYFSIQVTPIQYNPIKNSIKCCKSLTYRINHKNSNVSYNLSDYKELKKIIGENIDEDLRSPNTTQKRPVPSNQIIQGKEYADYLIVTTDKYLSAVNKFKNWKAMQGHKCRILSQSAWENAEEVKTQINNAYAIDKPTYLLIVGDVEDVPSNYISEEDLYSDLPYAIISQSGELTNLYPDMINGRISVSTLKEANIVTDKIINYERYPVEDEKFYNTATHCAVSTEATDDARTFDDYEDDYFILASETIRNYMLGWGKIVNRQYSSEYYPSHYMKYNVDLGLDMPEELLDHSLWTATPGSIENEFNEGRFYVSYNAHGNSDGWGSMNFGINNVKHLKNGNKLPVVFSITCLSGKFDVQECFAEAMIRQKDGGGVGVVAASKEGFFLWVETLEIGMFNTLFPNPGIKIHFGQLSSPGWYADNTQQDYGTVGEYEMGKVLRQGMMKSYQMVNAVNNRTLLEFHYFGDPSMEMYTETPACFNPIINQEGTTVTVNTGGVENCTIALSSVLDGGDSHVYCVENASSVTFTDIDFPYSVVIRKHNYKPYVVNSVYLQNEDITENTSITADYIFAGNEVNPYQPQGDVSVKDGTLLLTAHKAIEMRKGFKVDGGKLIAQLGEKTCPFSNEETISQYNSTIAPNRRPPIPNESTEANNTSNGSDLIYTKNQTIIMQLATSSDIEIRDVIGRVVYARSSVKEAEIPLNSGIYFVLYGDECQKVIVAGE